MMHLDEGTIVTLRDRQPAAHADRAHLDACDRCRAEIDDARERAHLVGEALRSLDGFVDMDTARVKLRARLDARSERPAGASRRGFRPADLRRAAVVLLVTAGAVSALPGAPLHRWLTADPTAPAPVANAPDRAEAARDGARAAVMVGLRDPGVRVLIHTSASLERVEVVWTDEAMVRVDAPTGSRFTYGEGRIEATVDGGSVQIELPRQGAPVQVEVDGRVYLSRTSSGVVVDAPIVERSDARILFALP